MQRYDCYRTQQTKHMFFYMFYNINWFISNEIVYAYWPEKNIIRKVFPDRPDKGSKIESYRLSTQKLPTFLMKVTDFLHKSYQLSSWKLPTFYKKIYLFFQKVGMFPIIQISWLTKKAISIPIMIRDGLSYLWLFRYFSIPALLLILSLTAGPLFSHTLHGPLAFLRYFSVGVQLLRTVIHDDPSSV